MSTTFATQEPPKIIEKRSTDTLEDDLSVVLLDNFFETSSTLGPEVLNHPKYNKLLNPLEIKHVYGFNSQVPVINLTSDNRREIYYAATNTGVFYNYCTKTLSHVKGHQNRIVSASADSAGKWLVVADLGKDNAVMIWDTETKELVATYFDYPPQPSSVALASMSPSAKLMITSYYKVTNEGDEGSEGTYDYYGYDKDSSNSSKKSDGNDGAVVDFWLWTYGNDQPDDSYAVQSSYGRPKSIAFHPNKEEHIMVVFDKGVIFFTWDYTESKVGISSLPTIAHLNQWGGLTDGTYVWNCHQCVVGSLKGAIFVFGNSLYSKNYDEGALDNAKISVTTIKISKGCINCVKSVDGFIITGDSTGNILFFDHRVRLLYWFTKFGVGGINSLSFALNPRKYVIDEEGARQHAQFHCSEEDRSEQYEILLKQSIPIDASLKQNHIITPTDGAIYHVDFISGTCTNISGVFDSPIAAIAIYDEKSLLIVAFKNGRITLFNYETHEEVRSVVLPSDKDSGEVATVTAIGYSKFSFHLACGKSNGDLWILHPLLLVPILTVPLRFSNGSIEKIIFSPDAQQMSYYDDKGTVFALLYQADEKSWQFCGKLRSHYKPIKNILFTEQCPFNIVTIGADRYLIQYDPIELHSDELTIKSRDRVDQRDVPEYLIFNRSKQKSANFYYLLADNNYKFKTLNQKTLMCTSIHLGPAHGCFRNQPVKKMEFLPTAEDKYLIFMNDKHIGLQLLPIDGNPYKFVGTVAHPEELSDFKISTNGKYVFTIGKNDCTIFMWDIRLWSVESLCQLGGDELMPFYCLFEGGSNGWLFQEMQDLFYYMQILHQGENMVLPRVVSDCVSIVEVPDLVRACGHYPTEYEIENMMTDIRYKHFDESGQTVDKITFIDFVKLYVNHRPAHGYSLKVLEESFDVLVNAFDPSCGGLERDDFTDALTTQGEVYTIEHVHKCMTTLLRNQEYFSDDYRHCDDFVYLPPVIDFRMLSEDILGIDLNVKEEDLQANDAAKDLEEADD